MRLFVKIFLSYWLAQALFLVLAIAVTFAIRPSGEVAQMENLGPRILEQAVQQYQAGGTEVARRYLRGQHDQYQVHFSLINEQGVDLTGRKPPDFIQRVVQGKERTADSFWGRLGPARFLRYAINASDGHRYTLVVAFPPEEHQLFSLHGVPGLGIIIAIISSGLVCYFLARFVTAPVVRLRKATQRLAEGDLAARAGVPNQNGRDEIAHLVRDFDTMAERLQNLVNAQSRLLNDISHELRSPLARLNVALGLARRRTGPEAEATLDRIEHEAERLNELIGRLLTVARLESGEDGVSRNSFDLDELLREVAQDADYEAQSRNCHVRVTSDSPCPVNGNRALLRSAIENVIRNAIRYTAEGTDVYANLHCQPGPEARDAILEVLDSGPGVPEEALDKLFRPFYRIDDARGRQTGGVGLGLSITDRAVRWHHGMVKAMNRPEGGLRVEISLPIAGSRGIAQSNAHILTASET